MREVNPYDKYTIHAVVLVVAIFFLFIGLKVWAKNELCSVYYSEMNRMACFLSDSTLPQKNNR